MIDPPLRNTSFTWSNMQEIPIYKRLDRFLFTVEWDNFFPQCIQEALPRWTSNHIPVCLVTNPFKWGPTPFRFENMWLMHPEFKDNFSLWWQECQEDGWEGYRFMRKLKFDKSKLIEWNKDTFGILRERKSTIISDIERFDRLEQEGSLNQDTFVLRSFRRKQLEEVLMKEEVFWRQRSRIK